MTNEDDLILKSDISMLSFFALAFTARADEEDLIQCPANIEDVTFQAKEMTFEPRKWTYFYSTHLPDHDELNVKVHADINLKIDAGKGLKCPNNNNKAQLVKDNNVFIFKSELGIGIFGVYNNNDDPVNGVVSVSGSNPNNHDDPKWVTFTGVYLGLCLLLLVLLFVHAILARDKVHYKVDVQE